MSNKTKDSVSAPTGPKKDAIAPKRKASGTPPDPKDPKKPRKEKSPEREESPSDSSRSVSPEEEDVDPIFQSVFEWGIFAVMAYALKYANSVFARLPESPIFCFTFLARTTGELRFTGKGVEYNLQTEAGAALFLQEEISVPIMVVAVPPTMPGNPNRSYLVVFTERVARTDIRIIPNRFQAIKKGLGYIISRYYGVEYDRSWLHVENLPHGAKWKDLEPAVKSSLGCELVKGRTIRMELGGMKVIAGPSSHKGSGASLSRGVWLVSLPEDVAEINRILRSDAQIVGKGNAQGAILRLGVGWDPCRTCGFLFHLNTDCPFQKLLTSEPDPSEVRRRHWLFDPPLPKKVAQPKASTSAVPKAAKKKQPKPTKKPQVADKKGKGKAKAETPESEEEEAMDEEE